MREWCKQLLFATRPGKESVTTVTTDDSGSSAPLHQRIARDIRMQIEAGTLRDGETLPSSRELAERWRTSVFTISTVMKTLGEEGLIESRDRSRRIVRSPKPAAGARPRAAHVVLIGGYAGSGKTEFGRILARQSGWMIIDKDTTTRPVLEFALEALGLPPNDRESVEYVQKLRPLEYEALMSTAHENTECGVGAIVTAPFIKEFADSAWIEREAARFKADGVPVTLVWVRCDAETMHGYLRRRGAARDTYKLAHWDEYAAGLNFEFTPAAGRQVIIDNSASAEPLTAQAERLLADLEAKAKQ